MNLKELVPPLELCELIPAGEFVGSAFVWLNIQYVTIPWKVVERRISRYKMERNKKSFPAPTLQEIMEKLPHSMCYKHALPGGYTMRTGNRFELSLSDESAVTAALKLWLKLKGIENDQSN